MKISTTKEDISNFAKELVKAIKMVVYGEQQLLKNLEKTQWISVYE